MSPKQLSAALRHLKKDKRLARVIAKSEKPTFERGRDPYQALIRSIIYQQLSGKAAGTILRRFLEIYPGHRLPAGRQGYPKPAQVLKTPLATMRKAGVSAQKAGYLKDLSKKFIDGTIDPKHFHEMTDEAIREHLIAVKGIGRWTADMFLMFTLHRPDVLPTGDLGIQKGMRELCGLSRLPDPKKMEKLAEQWRPYRTIASMYLWKVVDGD